MPIAITSQELLSQTVLTLCTFLLVSAARKLWPKLDGKYLVLSCSVISGALLSCLSLLLFSPVEVLSSWASWQGVILLGVGAGVTSFGAANGWQWLGSKLPSAVNVVLGGEKHNDTDNDHNDHDEQESQD